MADSSRLDAWRRLTLDPCNRTVERRNWASTRDALEQIVNYITNIANVSGSGPVLFKVTTTAIGAASTDAVLLTLPDFTDDGAGVVIYDYTPNRRFARNFVDGYYGVGFLAPEIAENAVVVMELEGKARFIDGTMNENMPVDKMVQVSVDNYWGAFPNIHDPGTNFDVHDRNNFAPNATTGDRFLAVWDEQEQEYVLVNHYKASESTDVILFRLEETDIGATSISAKEWNYVSEDWTGRDLTVYDLTPNLRYAQNFEDGYIGWGRLSQEIAADAVVVFEMEGKARFIDGTLAEDVVGGNSSGDVENYWGAYPNIHDPGTPVDLVDREGYAEGAQAGARFLAVWDEQTQEYILILPVVTPSVANVEFLRYCATGDVELDIANECCLFPGEIFRIDSASTNFCEPAYCVTPVWLYCYQGVSQYQPWPLGEGWCDFGRFIRSNFNCAGDGRDVYGIDCGLCTPCDCPGAHMYATVQAFDCQGDKGFSMTKVSQNPITGSGSEGWWGEFTLSGFYPLSVMQIPTVLFSFNGEDHTEVYVSLACNQTPYATLADLCTAGKVYVLMLSGDYVEYTGPYESTGVDLEQTFVDSEDCQVFCSRTFTYGVFIQCSVNPDPLQKSLSGGVIYHLWPEGSITRIEDPLLGLSVPSPGQNFDDPDSIDMVGLDNQPTTVECCEYTQLGRFNPDFGDTYSCGAIVLPNDISGRTCSSDVMKYHVFGGCKDTIAYYHGALPICGDTTGSDYVYIQFDWSGTDQCKEA